MKIQHCVKEVVHQMASVPEGAVLHYRASSRKGHLGRNHWSRRTHEMTQGRSQQSQSQKKNDSKKCAAYHQAVISLCFSAFDATREHRPSLRDQTVDKIPFREYGVNQQLGTPTFQPNCFPFSPVTNLMQPNLHDLAQNTAPGK